MKGIIKVYNLEGDLHAVIPDEFGSITSIITFYYYTCRDYTSKVDLTVSLAGGIDIELSIFFHLTPILAIQTCRGRTDIEMGEVLRWT